MFNLHQLIQLLKAIKITSQTMLNISQTMLL